MRPPLTILITFLAAAIVGLALPARAPAQSTDLAGIRDAIESNAELLMEATALVRSTNSVKARAALEAARRLHEMSMSELSMGNRLMAGRAARDAREAILRAIAIARREVKLEEGAMRAIERAAQRLDQARTDLDEFGGPGDTPARKLIEESQDQLQRAQNNMREHMFEVALQLATASSDMSGRAMQLLKRDVATPELVRREIDRTAQVMARFEERDTAGQPDMAGVIADARQLQERAVHSARNQNWRLALEQTHRARDMALRILKMPGAADVGEDDVRRAFDLTDEVLDRAAHIAREEGLDDVARRVDDAGEVQRRAREELDRRRPGAAMQLTLRAREMAKDALAAAQKPIDRDTAASALRRTDEILTRLRDALARTPDPPAQAILERASERQQEARKAFEAGDLRKALALTRVARAMAARVGHQPGNGDE